MSDSDLDKLKKENEFLSRSLDAYDKLFRLNEEEILNLEEMVEMYDRITNFNREEMIFKEKMQNALETVIESNRDDLIDRSKSFEALEIAMEMCQDELMILGGSAKKKFTLGVTLKNTIDNLFSGHAKGVIDKTEMFTIVEKAFKSSKEELLNAQKRIKILEQENKKLKEKKEQLS